jgi:paraquat-inducible protein B
MNHATSLRRAILLLAATLALQLQAAEPAKEPAKAAETTPADKEVLALPKVEVTSARIKQIDNEIKKVEKQIAREKKKLKSTDLDKSLNSDKVSTAAAIFGGNSASHMVAVAASRVNLLESERNLLERLKFPRTEEDKAMIEKELVSLRTTRRNLDDAAKQR